MFVLQTTGVELLMKCVNIPETSDSVVSPVAPSPAARSLPSSRVESGLSYAERRSPADTLPDNQPF